MPIKMTIGGVEVTVDSAQEAAILLKEMGGQTTQPAPEPEPEPVTQPLPPSEIILPHSRVPSKGTTRRLSYDKANTARRMYYDQRYSISEIARALDVPEESIRMCINGDTWNEATVASYKVKGEKIRQAKVEKEQPLGKPQGLAPTPPSVPVSQSQEMFELIAMGEDPNEVMRAYKTTRQAVTEAWTVNYSRSMQNSKDTSTKNKLSRINQSMQLWILRSPGSPVSSVRLR